MNDPRTGRSDIFSQDCIPTKSRMYSVGTKVDSSGMTTPQDKINGPFVIEMNSWTARELVSNVLAILAAEGYGYEVSSHPPSCTSST